MHVTVKTKRKYSFIISIHKISILAIRSIHRIWTGADWNKELLLSKTLKLLQISTKAIIFSFLSNIHFFREECNLIRATNKLKINLIYNFCFCKHMYFDNCRWQEITFYCLSLANGKFTCFNLASYVENIQMYSVCVSSFKGQKLFVARKNLTWFGKRVSFLPRASKTRLNLMEVVIKYLRSKGCKNCSL